jgi:hypothetical protein
MPRSLPQSLLAGLFAPLAALAEPGMPRDVNWLLGHVRATADNRQAPFMVLDKRQARLWVLDPSGRLVAQSPVLLGFAAGDDTVPGIGERPLDKVLPHEKTTPAGRFALEPGRNLRGENVFWVDYEAGVSLHKVIRGTPAEQRLQRLATPSAADNRISFGCINVPARFFEQVVSPTFGRLAAGRAFIYVLPETRPVQTVFGR